MATLEFLSATGTVTGSRAINEIKGPVLIISASGMVTGGRVRRMAGARARVP